MLIPFWFEVVHTVRTISAAVVASAASIATILANVATILTRSADIPFIRAQTDAIAVLTEAGGTIASDGTEQDVYINNAPAGVFKPICVKVDFTNHTVAETVVLRTYYRIAPAGDMILQDEVTYAGLVTPELVKIELEPNRYGIQVTLERTAGGAQDYDWEAFYEVAP